MKKQKERTAYVAPSIEIIEVENEGGVMNASLRGFTDNSFYRTRNPDTGVQYYNTGTAGDLEELINNILTIEK